MFAESLTIRILADSSQFRTELDSALSLLDRLRDSVGTVAEAGRTLAASFSRLASATTPLQQIGKLLSAIHQQIETINQTPLSINVDLALNALAQLSGMIDSVAAKLSALSSIGSPPTAGALPGSPGPFPSGFSPGIAAPLPGLPGKLAASVASGVATTSRSSSNVSSASTTNNFGGITIQVREVADVNALVRDLRLHGIHLRNRRG